MAVPSGPDPADRPAVDPEVAWIDVDGEVVAVHRRAETIHLISASGALLWPFLDGSASVEELAEDVSAVFGIEPEQALADVSAFVSDMRAQGLVLDGDAAAGGADA